MSHNHTFVICAYGDSRYLEECIQSLVNQSLKTDIILYTSTPSNYIEGLCEKYDIPVFSSVGGGIGKDWNNALSFVQTQYATIVHQDDIYLSDYAKNVLSSVSDDTLIAYPARFRPSPHFSHPHGSAPGGAAFCFTRRRDREGSGPRAANRGQAGEVLRAARCVEGASGAVRA